MDRSQATKPRFPAQTLAGNPRHEFQRMYNNRRWRSCRLVHLRKHPLCVRCLLSGQVTEATVVDHIKPHHGDPVLFWDKTNWQSLCASCHSGGKKTEEQRGFAPGANAEGLPIDPKHHWYRKG